MPQKIQKVNKKIKLTNKFISQIKPRGGAFLALVRAIIYQQLATKAADSIARKFCALFAPKRPEPETVLHLSTEQFKASGISAQKEKYLRDLAEKFIDGAIQIKKFSEMSDVEIKNNLMQVKGVGPWSADMFLIFTLKRPNILPLGDLGIKHGFKKYFELKDLPDEKKMLELAEPYFGNWTELSLFLWDFKDNK